MALQYIYPPNGNFSEETANLSIRMEADRLMEEARHLPVSIIVAAGRNGEIGKKGEMIWHLREDLRRFKRLTTGHPVIMGRNTWLSLPKRPLPNRRNIVISRREGFTAEGAETFPSLAEAVTACAGSPEIFIIGGGQVYEQAIPLASKIYLTEVDAADPEADTFFPLPDDEWLRLPPVDDEVAEGVTPEGIAYRFVTYMRR